MSLWSIKIFPMRDVVVVFGLSGSGKSFLSRILHEDFGYEWIRSDVVRKELAGIEPERSAGAPFGEGIYTEEMTERVYREMIRRAKEVVNRGGRVVLDATFLKRWQRRLVLESFRNPLFILAKASDEEIRRRLSGRRDVSDADYEIYLRQKEVFEEPDEIDFVEVNTERTEEELREILKNLVKD